MSLLNFNKEPAVLIGVAASVLIGAIQTIVGGGILDADAGQSAINIITAASPVLLQLVTRQFVFSPATVAAILIALGRSTDKEDVAKLAESGKSYNPNPKLT